MEVTENFRWSRKSDHLLLSSQDTISVSDYCNESSIEPHSRYNRKYALKLLAKANDKATPEEVIEDIKAGKVTLYSASKRMIDSIRPRMKVSTVVFYRSILPEMFRSVLGEDNFRQTVFDRLVPRGDYYIHSTKKVPTPDELRYILRIATPQYRAVVGGLASGGFRINEWVNRRMSDLEVRPSGIGRIKLQAGATKARIKRYVFITKEVVEWIRQYHLGLNDNGWIFPGELGTHLHSSTAYGAMKTLFRKTGLNDSEDGSEIYSPHSFRTFADSQMAKCGLDRKFIAAIIGHKSKLAAEASYIDWDEVESQWTEKCNEKLTWLTEIVTVTIPDPHLQEQIDQLKQIVLYQIAYGNVSYNPKELARFGITKEEIEKAKELAEHFGEEPQKQIEDKSE